jgi:hypothetical protein
LRWLVIATVGLYLALALVGTYVYVDGVHRREDLEEIAVQTNDALCALRVDLEARVAASEQFLEDNPNGIPGLPAAVIRTGITNQQRTIEALGDLECVVS